MHRFYTLGDGSNIHQGRRLEAELVVWNLVAEPVVKGKVVK